MEDSHGIPKCRTKATSGKLQDTPALGTYNRVRSVPTALPVPTGSLLAAAAIVIADVLASGAVGQVGNTRRSGGGLLSRLGQGESAGGENGEEDECRELHCVDGSGLSWNLEVYLDERAAGR